MVLASGRFCIIMKHISSFRRFMAKEYRTGGKKMQYTIENQDLKLTVDTHGAEMVELIHKVTGEQMLWTAGEAWNRHAPMLFPHTGRLKDHTYTVDGKQYTSNQHGFVRDLEHTVVEKSAESITFEVTANEFTRTRFPFEFIFRTTYTLMGNTVRHAVEVVNAGDKEMRFGFGYHPGFLCPFDSSHTTEDYELRFDIPQTPVEQKTPGGLCGETCVYMENSDVIQVTDQLFQSDSICLTQLTAKTLSLVEKGTGRKVEVSIEGFPCVLVWSASTPKLQFVCIEPWHSLPDRVDASGKWEDKPCAAALKAGESWSTHLDMTFVR